MLDTPFMLVELSVMEQRYQAVSLVVHDGESVVEVARRFNVSRQTVHAWLARYERGGLAALADRSHRPKGCAHQMPAAIEAVVLEMRRVNPDWGPRRLLHELAREGVGPLPSRSGIYRLLKRHDQIDVHARRKWDRKYKRWERGTAMELWQMDVVGGILLADGTELKALTGIDDHSRFIVCAGLMVRANSRSVCSHFADAMRTYGVPQELLTDNGKVFTGRFGRGKVEVLFDRICRENGIDHLLTAPRSPTTTGKIERWHRTLREEFLAGKVFTSRADAQAQLDAWVSTYNYERPHDSLDMATPASRFLTARAEERPADASALQALDRSGDDWIARRVSAVGVVCVAWQQISVGKHRAGHTVDIHVGPQLLHIWDGNELLKTALRDNTKEVRKKRASVAN